VEGQIRHSKPIEQTSKDGIHGDAKESVFKIMLMENKLVFSERFHRSLDWILPGRREVVKTSVRSLLPVTIAGKEGFNGSRNQPELSLHGGTRRSRNWGGDPSPHRSGIWGEYCSFWIEDDGWNGFSEELSVTVRGTSFEEATTKMEEALREQIDLAKWQVDGFGFT
jgi:hypothetical protein